MRSEKRRVRLSYIDHERPYNGNALVFCERDSKLFKEFKEWSDMIQCAFGIIILEPVKKFIERKLH